MLGLTSLKLLQQWDSSYVYYRQHQSGWLLLVHVFADENLLCVLHGKEVLNAVQVVIAHRLKVKLGHDLTSRNILFSLLKEHLCEAGHSEFRQRSQNLENIVRIHFLVRFTNSEQGVSAASFNAIARVHVSHELTGVNETGMILIDVSEELINLVVADFCVACLDDELLELRMIQFSSAARSNCALPGSELLESFPQVFH